MYGHIQGNNFLALSSRQMLGSAFIIKHRGLKYFPKQDIYRAHYTVADELRLMKELDTHDIKA